MTLVPLPANLTAAAVVLAMAASAVLSGLSAAGLGNVPGFRARDASRNAALRVLLGALNLAGLLAYAWSQNIALDRSQLPALLVTVIGAGVGGHLVYSAVKSGASAATSSVVTLHTFDGTTQASAPAVPPLPSDPLPVPAPVPVASKP